MIMRHTVFKGHEDSLTPFAKAGEPPSRAELERAAYAYGDTFPLLVFFNTRDRFEMLQSGSPLELSQEILEALDIGALIEGTGTTAGQIVAIANTHKEMADIVPGYGPIVTMA